MQSSVDGYFGCFHFLATMNNAAMSTGVKVFVETFVFIFLSFIPMRRTAWSYNSMMNLLRN